MPERKIFLSHNVQRLFDSGHYFIKINDSGSLNGGLFGFVNIYLKRYNFTADLSQRR